MKKFHLVLLSILVVGTDQGHARESERDEEIRELQQQIELMQKQLVSMQAQLLEMQAEDPASEVQTDDPATELADSDAQEEQISPVVLDQRVSNLEAVADDWLGAFKFGGAVRLNYSWRDFDEQDKDRFGDFELELFRINADGEIGDVRLSAEWRRYNDFQAIHHAWVGYEFNDQIEARVGISQVPFGILPFASHSFWFGGTYYLGLEDDYDTGVQFVHEPNDDWTFHYAFY
ncbi:MAG: porin, partial [Wenzhouxiangellaceae bacterium]